MKPASAAALARAFALPPLLAFLVLGAVAIAERAGGTLFAVAPPANIAEASALGRADLVFRYLRDGSDPLRIYPVAAHVISTAVRRVSAIEAAVWSRQVEMIQLLESTGALRDPATRRHVACLASDLDAEDLVDYLHPAGEPACMAEQALETIMDRGNAHASLAEER
jgi:hypothetical protein